MAGEVFEEGSKEASEMASEALRARLLLKCWTVAILTIWDSRQLIF